GARHGNYHSDAQRSQPCARRAACAVGHPAIHTLFTEGRLAERTATALGRGAGYIGTICAGVACLRHRGRIAGAARSRTGVSHQRRPLASRRPGIRSILDGAPGSGRGPAPYTRAGTVPVRSRLSPRRRRDGRGRPQCRARSTEMGREINMSDPSAPHFKQPLLRTPFYERHRALSQVDSFIPWAGYTTVDVFTTMEQEYFAIRNATTLYDLTPMVKYRVASPDAVSYLNRLVTRDIVTLKPDRVAYCVWCNDAGHLIDDGTVFRLGADEYRICTAERQLDWLLDSAIGFDVEISEVTEQIAALALQGPTSCAVLKSLGLQGVERLKPFEIGQFALDDHSLTVSRTGFTGDLGYELWMEPEAAESVWDALMRAGRSR